MKRILVSILLIFTFYSTSLSQDLERIGARYNGIQLAIDKSEAKFFINDFDFIIISKDSINITTDQFIEEVKELDMEQTEIDLMVRIIQLNQTPIEKFEEMQSMAKTFPEVNLALIKAYYKELKSQLGESKLLELIQQN